MEESDLPPPRRKILRIGERLTTLPLELIDPVISDLPLHRALELIYPSTGPNETLVGAAESCLRWRSLFGRQPNKIRGRWEFLNQLAWFWAREPWMPRFNVMFKGTVLDGRPLSIGSEVVTNICLASFRSLMRCPKSLGFNGLREHELQAICLFMPAEVLTAIVTDDAATLLGEKEAQTERPLGSVSYREYLEAPFVDEVALRDTYVDGLVHHDWTFEKASAAMKCLSRAYRLLRQAWSAELSITADLFERHPRLLKKPFAPDTDRQNHDHLLSALRRDAEAALTRRIRTPGNLEGNSRPGDAFTCWYRFRYPHAALVPYDWCLRLFNLVLQAHPPPSGAAECYPQELIPDLERAADGLAFIYQHGGDAGAIKFRRPRWNHAEVEAASPLACFSTYPESRRLLPRPPAELEWLRSFVRIVDWMERTYPTLAASARGAGAHVSASPSPFVHVGNDSGVEHPRIRPRPRPRPRRSPHNAQRRPFEESDYRLHIAQEPARHIARQLVLDSDAAEHNFHPWKGLQKLPSLLALYLPPASSARARQISMHLVSSRDAGPDFREMVYAGMVRWVRQCLEGAPKAARQAAGGVLLHEMRTTGVGGRRDGLSFTPLTSSIRVVHSDYALTGFASKLKAAGIKMEDLDTSQRTMRSLLSLVLSGAGADDYLVRQVDPEKVRAGLEAIDPLTPEGLQRGRAGGADAWDESVEEYLRSLADKAPARDWQSPAQPANRTCYICQTKNTTPHPTMRSMCEACGDFNLGGSRLSLPTTLGLSGKTALVTGGRVNLGYHVALRLLRCGARVIVSTRYPHDAVARFAAEPDAASWSGGGEGSSGGDRLKIIGADFRAARDAFRLVKTVRDLVESWAGGKLDILINNAAQTLTDSVETEGKAVEREGILRSEMNLLDGRSQLLPHQHPYLPRVRGLANGDPAAIQEPDPLLLAPHASGREAPSSSLSTAARLDLALPPTQMANPTGSSWTQTLEEIPYEDVISAHSVNALVPLILVRELLPLMRTTPGGGGAGSRQPWCEWPGDVLLAGAYVVNVSSREGIFESLAPGVNSAKAGRHVHTNMSKAALNMITETEAAACWEDGRVAMNTVDPGYMSAAPEVEAAAAAAGAGERPIGWEDGAGRVLWPVAMGELAWSEVLRKEEAERSGSGPAWTRGRGRGRGRSGAARTLMGVRFGGGDAERRYTVWGRFLKHYGAARVEPRFGR